MPRFNPFSKAKRGDDPKGSADAGAAEPDAGARREVKLHKRLRRAAEGCAPQAARDALSGLRRRDKREKHTVERADFVAALQELLHKLGEEQVGEVATAFADADGKRVLYVDAFRQLFGPDVLDTEAPAASPLDRLDAEAQAELRGVAESAVPALRGALEGHDVATRGEIRAKRFIEEVQAATRRRIRSQDAEALASAFPGSRAKSTDYNAFLTELERWASSDAGSREGSAGEGVDWDGACSLLSQHDLRPPQLTRHVPTSVVAAVADKMKQEVDRLSEERGESAVEDVFAALDEDDSGTLSSRELKRALRRLGVDVEEGERQALISALDANGSGQMDMDEFVDMCLDGAKAVRKRAAKLGQSSATAQGGGVDWAALRKVAVKVNKRGEREGREGEIEAAFVEMDQSGDGRISSEELDRGLSALSISLTRQERDCLARALDADGDGKLDLAEFEDLCLEGEAAVKKLKTALEAPRAPAVVKGAAPEGDGGNSSGGEGGAAPGAGSPPTALSEEEQEGWAAALEKAAAAWKTALAPRSGEARASTPAFGILEDTARARPAGFSLRRVSAALLTAGVEPDDALAREIAPVLALARPGRDRATGAVPRDAAPEQVRVLGEPLLKLARGGARSARDLLAAHPAREWARDVDGVARCLAKALRAGWGAAPGEHAPGGKMLASLRRANALAPAIASWDAFYAVLAAGSHRRSGRAARGPRGASPGWDPMVSADAVVEALRGAGIGATAHAAGRELVRECARAGGRARISALRRAAASALLEDESTFGPDPWRDVAESLCMGEVGDAAEGAVAEQDCAALLREAHALALSGGPSSAEAVAADLGVEVGDGERRDRGRGRRGRRARASRPAKRTLASWEDAEDVLGRFLPGLAPIAARSLLESLSRGEGGVDAAGLVRVLEAAGGAAVEYPRAAASGAARVDAASAARFRSDLVAYLQRGRGARSELVAASQDLDFTDSGFLALEEMAAALRSVGVSATGALVASLAGQEGPKRAPTMMGNTVQYAPFIRHWTLEALEAAEAQLSGREPHARDAYVQDRVTAAEWSAGSYRPPHGSLGEWLYTSASDVERRNFVQLLQQLQRFEEGTGLAQSRRARGRERFYGASVGDDAVVLQLGTKLRCEMRFHVDK